MSEPWAILPNESPRAFHAFTHYRDLAPHRRSIDSAFAAHRIDCLAGNQDGSTTVPSQWKKWSTQHSWVSRVAEYDAHCDHLRRAAQEEALMNAPERWAEVARDIQQRAIDALRGVDLSSQPIRELRLLVTEGVRMEKEAFEFDIRRGGDVDGGIRRFLEATRLSPEPVAALLEDAAVPDDGQCPPSGDGG